MARHFFDALKQLGMRGILCAGWANWKNTAEVLENEANMVLLIRDIPHENLLPQCLMVILTSTDMHTALFLPLLV